MKKIAFFLGDLQLGGAERVVSILASHLTDKYDVTIISYYDKPSLYALNDRVKQFHLEKESGSGSRLKNLVFLHRELKKYDVVLSFMAIYNIYALLSSIGTKTPLIVADRNDPSRIPSKGLLRFVRNLLYKRSCVLVVQNEHNGKYFTHHGNRSYTVVQNPISDEMNRLRVQALQTQKQPVIVSSGRLVPAKDQATMIKAFHLFVQKHPEYRLYIYGDGPLENELKALVKELNLVDCVFLPGYEAHVIEKQIQATMFVFSSLFEGSSNAVLEALCLDLPVVTTPVAGTEDVIKEGENGFFIEYHDVEGMAQAMEKIVADEAYWIHTPKPINEALNQSIQAPTIVNQWKKIIGIALSK